MDPDPWKWTVEGVQQFFRNDAPTYISDMPHVRLPELDSFLSVLNENDVTGAILLTSIDPPSLRDDFGVKNLGQRGAVWHCITKLRRQSTIHAAQSAPSFGLQTPPQLPFLTLPPTLNTPEAAAAPNENGADVKTHVRSREVEVEDSHGRKRRKLHLSKPEASLEPKRKSIDLTTAPERKEYFGDSAFPIAEIFYNQTAFGREIGPSKLVGDVLVLDPDRCAGLEDNNFQFTVQNKSVGETHYVYSHICHFLNSTDRGIEVRRRGRMALGFLPHRNIAGAEARSAIVLQFKDGSEEPVAVKENAAYLLSGFDLDGSLNQSPGENDYLLEKYKPSEVLPLWDPAELEHSDDDDESSSTVDGAAQEAEEVDDVEDLDLTAERVHDTIEDFIDRCIHRWTDQLQRLEQRRAWSVWKKMKGSRSIREALIGGAEALIDRLTKRLEEMKEKILSNTWQNEESIRGACVAMEPTIEDMEEQRWMISVWRRRQEPYHVVRHSKHSKAPALPAPATERGEKGIVVHPYDRFSLSPGPIIRDELDNDADDEMHHDNHDDDEIQYEVDDEVFETPSNSPVNPSAASPFVVPTPDEANFAPGEGEDEAPLREESDADLPIVPPNIEAATSSKDENYSPADSDGSESELPCASTFVAPRADKSPFKPLDSMKSSDSPTPKMRGRPPKGALKKIVDFDDKVVATDATASEVDAWDLSALVRREDRQRLLIKLLREAGPKLRDRLDKFLRSPQLGRRVFAAQLEAAVHSCRTGTTDPRMRKDTAETMMHAAEIYIRYSIPRVAEQGRGTLDKHSWNGIVKPSQFEMFTHLLGSVLIKNSTKLFVTPKSSPSKLGSSSAPIDISSGSSDQRPKHDPTPHKRRKKAVARSATARDSRASAFNRQQRYNESQTTNSTQLVAMLHSDPSHSSIAINPVKVLDDEAIYISDRIARKMKAHQIDGTHFLWREITADGEEGGQGCILAHTMGLGKTMQTIALLAALNEAAASTEPRIYEQLPPHLRPKEVRAGRRQLKTVILCPPGLLQNWCQEIEQWAPSQLGNVIVLESGNKSTHMHQLKEWMRVGGVLIVGYEMFQSMLTRKPEQKHPRPAEEIAKFEEFLLEGSEIVVADEAQKIKNEKSGISILASRFSTESRIALTGTPMSNDVGEIYALVSWVAPGYLGNATEFRARFAEPIKDGLYTESTAYERRKSSKKLAVLHAEIEPKVNRANIEVLRGSLKPKIEYVITVPLGTVQQRLYSRYIKTLLCGDRTENASQVTLFGWLNDLTLLTNHPECFRQKLLAPPPARKTKKHNREGFGQDLTSREQTPSTSTESGSATPLDPGMTTDGELLAEDGTIMESADGEETSKLDPSEIQAILDGFQEDMDPELSAKAIIFIELLHLSLEVQDKVLVFSTSIRTIDYLEKLLGLRGHTVGRVDGKVQMSKRLETLDKFHNGGKFQKDGLNIVLVSSKAGGVGLNIQAANRVFVFDFGFNPSIEEQAIGRAYRLGQTKPVFVYRFVAGGTFETNIYNKQLFKSSLSARVVDKKNPRRNAERNAREYVYEPKSVPQQNLDGVAGNDPHVLDRLLSRHGSAEEGKIDTKIRAVSTMETLQEEALDAPLDEEEQKEVNEEIEANKKRPRGRKAANVDAFAPPGTAPPMAGNSRISSFNVLPDGTRRPSSTMAGGSTNGPVNHPGLVRLPLSTASMQPPPSTVGAAIANQGANHAHPMGGLPFPQPPNNGSN